MDPLDRGFRRRSLGNRLLVVFSMALVAIAGYYGARSYTPVPLLAGPSLRITPQQEASLGLQAAPAMAQRHGGLSPDQAAQRRADRVCHDLVEKTSAKASPYDFDCHVLADPGAVEAFALPGGQVFVTQGLLDKLRSDGQLAGVLGHEIGHVVARHGAEHVSEVQFPRGVTGAAILASYDPENPASRHTADVNVLIGRLIGLRFDQRDELEADRLGVRYMAEAGWNPGEMIEALRVLEASSPEAGLFVTHPNPPDRLRNLQAAIRRIPARGEETSHLTQDRTAALRRGR
jgi:predicted Zn-dependent protease